jgi:glucose/arabinose dehydrogenase
VRLRQALAWTAAAAGLCVSILLAWPGSGDGAVPARLTRVASGLGDALYVTSPPGDQRFFIVQQSGRILIRKNGRVLGRPFLNISGLVTAGGEQGLLGLAFHPDYASNGRFFVYYTDLQAQERVVEYRRSGNPDRASPGSARLILRMADPFPNHNGGDVQFGPDGMLYIGTGDGGSGGDPLGSGQSLDTLLGKILRIDVNRRSGGTPYAIPPDNPFVGRAGARPEIYVYGLRNPWRFSFDRQRRDLWIGDVGQGSWEEIDYRPAGRIAGSNFGWNAFEGRHPYPGGNAANGRTIAPVAEYSHAKGISVTGGYVYRGTAVPGLRGRYVFADYGSGRVWTMRAGPRPGPAREITGTLGTQLGTVTSFGEDSAGELYVIANQSLYRFTKR